MLALLPVDILAKDPLFWMKIEALPSGCWEWRGARHRTGYGHLKREGRGMRPHRYAYQLLVGAIPNGLQIDHQCHNLALAEGFCEGGPTCRHRRCCNPNHLEVTTNRVNTLRGDGPTARHARLTHCPQGHEYTPEN